MRRAKPGGRMSGMSPGAVPQRMVALRDSGTNGGRSGGPGGFGSAVFRGGTMNGMMGWITCGEPGRASAASIHMSSLKFVSMMKYWYGMPNRGISDVTSYGLSMVKITSGLPIRHSDENFNGGGRSLSSPFAQPSSIHLSSVSRSAAGSVRSLRKWPTRGSAYHGGIRLDATTSPIMSDQPAASS